MIQNQNTLQLSQVFDPPMNANPAGLQHPVIRIQRRGQFLLLALQPIGVGELKLREGLRCAFQE